MRELKDLERLAYHEAGHAVAAYLMNLRFKTVSIISKETGFERCHFTKWPKNYYQERNRSPKSRNLIEKEVTTVVAGHLSERMLAGETEPIGEHHDVTMAQKLLDSLCGSTEETDAYLRWQWVRTKNMLRLPLNWMMVEALATALIERRELSEESARSIFQETQGKWMNFRRKTIEE